MVQLNLPAFDYKVMKIDGKPHIFDITRKKYLLITPEEWVRQHVLHWLLNEYRYPKSLIKTESGLRYHQLTKRSDILVFDRSAKPFMLVECKASHIVLTDQVLQQAIRYNAVLKAPYLLISNGLSHFLYKIENGVALPVTQMPAFA
ncbi:MAG: type I restriction enzyme HsdR N-terminal domain-containing protein [Spirosomataceae bacterium]